MEAVVLPSDTAPVASAAPAPLVPGSPEYDTAMALKGTSALDLVNGERVELAPAPVTNAPAAVVRPAHIPEKFWDAATGTVKTDDLLKSYTELEKVKAKGPSLQPDATITAPEGAEAVVAAAGFNYADLSAEYSSNNGAITEATYTKLAAAGIDKSTVDLHIQGVLALSAQRTAEIYSVAGGESEYKAMAQWVQANVSRPEIEAYDKLVVDPSSKAAATMAAQGLYARYKAAVGNAPAHVEQGGNNQQVTGGYQNERAMVSDMNDPRYKTDENFRQAVQNKAAASNW